MNVLENPRECKEFQEHFPLFYQEALSPGLSQRIREHLKICNKCQELYQKELPLYHLSSTFKNPESPLEEHIETDLLSHLAYGKVKPEEQSESVRRHLDQCKICADALEKLKLLPENVDELIEQEKLPFLDSLDLTSVTKKAKPEALLGKIARLFWKPQLGYGLAILLLAIWLFNPQIRTVTEYESVIEYKLTPSVKVNLPAVIRGADQIPSFTIPSSPSYVEFRLYVNPEEQHSYNLEITSAKSGEVLHSLSDFKNFDEKGYAELTALLQEGDYKFVVDDIFLVDTISISRDFSLRVQKN